MKTFSALLAICAGIHRSPVNSPHEDQWRGVFFDLRLNGRLSKQSWGWWFETPTRPLWRHRNDSVAADAVSSPHHPPWYLLYMQDKRVLVFHDDKASLAILAFVLLYVSQSCPRLFFGCIQLYKTRYTTMWGLVMPSKKKLSVSVC